MSETLEERAMRYEGADLDIMEIERLRKRIAALEQELADARKENKANDELRTVIKLLLDHVDYTAGACRVNEMVGGALPYQILDRAKAALAAK